MKNEENVIEYMQGLAPLANSLEQLIAGSALSSQELGTLAYIQGYLSAAKSHLVQPEQSSDDGRIAGLDFPKAPSL